MNNNYTHSFSLKGFTGILIGVLSMFFIYSLNILINQYTTNIEGVSLLPISFFEILIAVISIAYILICYFSIVLINKYKIRKFQLIKSTKNTRLIKRIFWLTLLASSIVGIALLKLNLIKMIIPTSILVYGLFTIMIHKLTLGNSKILGFFFVLQSFLVILNIEIGFFLWGISFGLGHIFYAVIRKKNLGMN